MHIGCNKVPFLTKSSPRSESRSILLVERPLQSIVGCTRSCIEANWITLLECHEYNEYDEYNECCGWSKTCADLWYFWCYFLSWSLIGTAHFCCVVFSFYMALLCGQHLISFFFSWARTVTCDRRSSLHFILVGKQKQESALKNRSLAFMPFCLFAIACGCLVRFGS